LGDSPSPALLDSTVCVEKKLSLEHDYKALMTARKGLACARPCWRREIRLDWVGIQAAGRAATGDNWCLIHARQSLASN